MEPVLVVESVVVEVEPVVLARTIARADGWAIWQLEITLAEGAEGRWREAAALGVAAVERLAARRLQPETAAEAAALSEAAWRWSSRAPTAVELAYDLQSEHAPELAVAGARSFVGEPSVLAAAVDRLAAELARWRRCRTALEARTTAGKRGSARRRTGAGRSRGRGFQRRRVAGGWGAATRAPSWRERLSRPFFCVAAHAPTGKCRARVG